MLNPNAWVDAPAGMGPEGRVSLQVRVEFQNVFNRPFYPAPSLGNPQIPVSANGQGKYTSGFGFVNSFDLTPSGTKPASSPPGAGFSIAGGAAGRRGSLLRLILYEKPRPSLPFRGPCYTSLFGFPLIKKTLGDFPWRIEQRV